MNFNLTMPEEEATAEEEREIRRLFRNVLYETEDGKRLLGYILTSLGYWNATPTDEAVVLRNYGCWLLRKCGFRPEIELHLNMAVNAITDMPVLS